MITRRSLLVAPPAAALLAAAPAAAAEPEGDLALSPGRRQLFLDDEGIARQQGLERTFHRPEKRGAVLRSPRPEQTIQTRTAPVWDPQLGRYRLYVLSIPQNLWESADGLNWAPGPAPNRRIEMAVLDPAEKDPGRRYKAALTNEGFAVSPDGVTWTRTETPAVPSQDEANFSYHPEHGRYLHSVKRSGPFGRSVAIAASRDFRAWEDYGVVFHADEADQERGKRKIAARLAESRLQRPELDVPEQYSVQIYNMGVFWYEGLCLGMPSVFHQTGRVPKDWPGFEKLGLSPATLEAVRKYGDWTGFHEVQLALSRDLKSWKRLADRQPFLEDSPVGAGAYDLQTLIGPSAPVVRGDELWFYYTGIRQYAYVRSGVTPDYPDYVPDKGAVCLAVLRRDGFASLGAGSQPGELVTRPFVSPGTKLRVNVEARGEARMEALDGAGQVLAASAPLAGDHPWSEAQWATGDFAALHGRRIALRFALRDARLFSYAVE